MWWQEFIEDTEDIENIEIIEDIKILMTKIYKDIE